MPILSTDLRVFRAATNNDTGANGGEPSTVESVSGVSGNLFPRVGLAERTSGVTRVRKAFHRVNNADSQTLFDAHLFMFKHTPAVDSVTFIHSDMVETQGDVVLATATHYGAATLVNPVTSGDVTITVTPEQDEYSVFRVLDRVYINSKSTYEGAGDEEYATIDSITPEGSNLILTLSQQLVNSYAASGTVISSVLELQDINTSASISSFTSVAGTLDHTVFSVRQRGSLYDEVTFTFTSTTHFTCVSAKVGPLGSGNITTTFAPVNPSTSSAYFSVPASAWVGTFAELDTFTVRTVPAAEGVMYVQQVPPASPAFSGNSFTMVFAGETE